MPNSFFKKSFFLIFFCFCLGFFLVLSVSMVGAATEEECREKESAEQWDEAERCWNEYFGAQKSTLNNDIDNKTVQIELTSHKIGSTQETISSLEIEMANLSEKIENLDFGLDKLSGILLNRIEATYKRGRFDPFVLLISSGDFSEFVSRYQYLRMAQRHDRQLLFDLETTRADYEIQKGLKEEKQQELEAWKKRLEWEKTSLDLAVDAKKVLLKETEASYQRALARISAEKARLAGVSVFGKPAEFKQWPEDNFYFNQTDVRWAMMLIGGGVYYQPSDPSYMWKYGCAVTSMAMVLRQSGVDIDPGRLSQSPVYRADLMAWQDIPGQFGGAISVIGHGYGGYVTWEEIDRNLSAGQWVIVYVGGVGHYVVLTNKEGDNYRMHDPYFGPNLNFSDKYSQAAVDEMIIYTR